MKIAEVGNVIEGGVYQPFQSVCSSPHIVLLFLLLVVFVSKSELCYSFSPYTDVVFIYSLVQKVK